MPSTVSQRVLLLLVLALCAAVYYPGLFGDFVFDDVPNITENSRLQTADATVEGIRQAAFSADSGMLKRPVSMVTFWANHYVSGLDPFVFKLTNLVIHLLNGVGLFLLAKLLLKTPSLTAQWRGEGSGAAAIALTVSAIWLVHPLNLTSVLYVVQRMTSLAAMFVLAGLICYLVGRMRLLEGRSGFPLILIGVFGFGLLGVLSKENGALLPFYVAVIELTLFRFAARTTADTRTLKVFLAAIALVPLAAAITFVLTHPDWLLRSYQTRDFTLTERLMTETRVLWLYLKWTILPAPSALGLFHDDVVVSQGLFRPLTTIFSLTGIAAAVGAAFWCRKKLPLVSFAILWYLVGHSLESSFIGLELVYEHRNYLPIIGPMFAVVTMLRVAMSSVRLPVRAATAIVLVLAFSAVTWGRSYDWGDPYRLSMALVQHHPNSSRANHEAGLALGTAVLRNPALAPLHQDQIRKYFERSAELDQKAVSGLFSLILLDATTEGIIDEDLLQRLETRLAEAPLRFTVVGPFRSLLDWTIAGVVELPPEKVSALFEAALSNETANRRTRATLLSLLSAYQYSVVGDTQEAVSLALAATEADPTEPAHQISLADLAVKLENYKLANSALEEASRHDPFGRYVTATRRLRQSIATNDFGD